jgi:hypothetical protein
MTVPDRNRRTDLRAYAARFAAVLTLAVTAAACEMTPTSPVAEDARLAPVAESASLYDDNCASYTVCFTDGEGYGWDIERKDGRVEYGSSLVYEYGAHALQPGRANPGGFSFSDLRSFEVVESVDHGTEGKTVILSGSRSLAVTRHVYVSGEYGFIRWIDVYHNTVSSQGGQRIRYRTRAAPGAAGDGWTLQDDESGDDVFGPDDGWIVTATTTAQDAEATGYAAHVFHDGTTTPLDAGFSTDPNNGNSQGVHDVIYEFRLPGSSSVALMGFAVQGDDAADITATARWLAGLPAEALAHLGTDAPIINWTLPPPDADAPTINFIGNAGTYDVSEQVTITCEATDEGSGVANTSCPTVVESPAYELGTGVHEYTATAEDNAGNAATASTSFEVIATADGMATLIDEWVANGGVAGALISKLKGQAGGGGGPAALEAAGPGARETAGKRSERSRAGQLQAFINHVNAIRGRWLTDERADMLIEFARSL